MGPCAGGAVYSPAITDFTVMVDQTSHMFITGPDVIKTVTGEDVGFEELGGARTHNAVSGVAHHMAGDEKDAIEYVKQLLSYLPSNNLSEPPAFPEEADLAVTDEDRELDTLVPDSANQPYDMHTVIEHVLDDAEFFETQPLFAPNILTGFGRVEGRPVGIVANQPMQFAGCLDIDASEKAARFVRTCDAFNVPVITFVDVPGFLPGVDQEHYGIIRRGAKLIYAYAEATVPLITVITRKAFGGAYDVMGSKHLGADLNLAWPTAQIAVMGAQGAVNILHRRTIAEAEAAGDVEATRARLIQEYEDALLNPYIAAERGYIDAVVLPSDTRRHVVRGLRQLRTKRESLPPRSTATSPVEERPHEHQSRTGQPDPGGAGRRSGGSKGPSSRSHFHTTGHPDPGTRGPTRRGSLPQGSPAWAQRMDPHILARLRELFQGRGEPRAQPPPAGTLQTTHHSLGHHPVPLVIGVQLIPEVISRVQPIRIPGSAITRFRSTTPLNSPAHRTHSLTS